MAMESRVKSSTPQESKSVAQTSTGGKALPAVPVLQQLKEKEDVPSLQGKFIQPVQLEARGVIQRYKPSGRKEINEVKEAKKAYLTGSTDRDHEDAAFDSMVADAADMAEVRTKITALMAKKRLAEERREALRLASVTTPLATPASASLPTTRSSVVTTTTSPPLSLEDTDSASSTEVEAPKTGKGKRFRGTPLVLGPVPKTSAWKDAPVVIGSTESSTSSSSSEVIEDEDTTADNRIIRAIIASPANYRVNEIIVDGGQTADTIYYKMTVTDKRLLRAGGRRNRYQLRYTLYIHCHPAPISGNWLHIKATHGGTPENILTSGSALLSAHGAVLQSGIESWEETNRRPATHRFR
jgi:hypothetical protein